MGLRRFPIVTAALLLAFVIVFAPPAGAAPARSPPQPVPTMVADDVVGGVPGQTQGFVPPPSFSLASSSSLAYDEQLGLTFTQNFYSMLYNVTAVEQSDPTSGAGPAYLLQGLSDMGYWYQVSLL